MRATTDGRGMCGWRSLVAIVGTLAVSATAQAQVSVSNITPPAGERVGSVDPLPVSATITTEYLLDRVTASIGTTSVQLTCSGTGSCVGSLPLAPISSGNVTLTIQAIDTAQQTASATSALLLDRPPKVVLGADYSTHPAIGTANISASCMDDFGCSSLQIYAKQNRDGAEQLVAMGAASASVDITLAADLADQVSLRFAATDTIGAESSVTSRVDIQPSARSALVERSPGIVKDADATRTLYVNSSGALVLRTRATGEERVLQSGSGPLSAVQNALLTRFGAIFDVGNFTAGLWSGTRTIKEDHDGVVGTLLESSDAVVRPGVINVAGDWATYEGVVRNLQTGAVSTSKDNIQVASDGSSFYTDLTQRQAGGAVCEFGISRAGAKSLLGTFLRMTGSCGGSYLSSVSIVPEGAAWVHLSRSGIASDPGSFISMGTTSTRLPDGFEQAASLANREFYPSTRTVRNGDWVLFPALSTSSTLFVKRRAPNGDIDSPAPFADNANAKAVGPNGEALILRFASSGASKLLYEATVSNPPVLEAAGDGTARWVDGGWYYVLGDAVFRIGGRSTGGVSDGGVPSGGGPDAGGPLPQDAGTEAPSDASVTPVTTDAGTTSPDGAVTGSPGGPSSDGGNTSHSDAPIDAGVQDAPRQADDDDGCTLSGKPGPAGIELLMLALAIKLARRTRRGLSVGPPSKDAE